MAYCFKFSAALISNFLWNHCTQGAMKITEMEKTMFERGYIPQRTHRATGDGSASQDNDVVGPAIQTTQEYEEVQQESGNSANIYTSDTTANGGVPAAISTILQPFYGLIDLEKSFLQAVASSASDGNSLLDALVYFVVVPLSEIYLVR